MTLLALMMETFSTSYSYRDKRGNFQNVSRISNGVLVDNLNYTYHTGTNQIRRVNDLTNNVLGYKELTNNDYDQDNDGCIIYDAESDMHIVRDHNDMILSATQADSNIIILNRYDAQGQLHLRSIDSFGVVRTTARVGAFEYRNEAPTLLHHDHGFVAFDWGTTRRRLSHWNPDTDGYRTRVAFVQLQDFDDSS